MVIQSHWKFIEMSLELWDIRNKILHGITIEEQLRIQRIRAIQTVTRKYQEDTRSLRARFPRLYMETCQTLCDKPTLQLLKWIETFNLCQGYLSKDKMRKRRGIIRDVKRAYKMRSDFAPYIGTQLFHEPCSQLCKRDIAFLENWLIKFHSLIPQP